MVWHHYETPFLKQRPELQEVPPAASRIPDHLWWNCESCHDVTLEDKFVRNLSVCPTCDAHFPISVEERLVSLIDEGTAIEYDEDLRSIDPLSFFDTKSYAERLTVLQKKSGSLDAFASYEAQIKGVTVQLGIFDFQFLGGSMGTVVGEKIARLFRRAASRKTPAVIVTASGGARMQEGILSLFQMAKTCAALSVLRDAGYPFISVLTHPTTGGVAASFAMLGDINIGEPGSLIGFAGPRVIQQTIGAQLPEGFQTAEYLLEHGMLDLIVHRSELRDKLHAILTILLQRIETMLL